MIFLFCILVVVAYLFGRYRKEVHYDRELDALKKTANWWRERYESIRPPPPSESSPGIKWETPHGPPHGGLQAAQKGGHCGEKS